MGVNVMHENFLSYIMIGLSRGLFPVQASRPSRFDEEAFLRREAKARWEEASASRNALDKQVAVRPPQAGPDAPSSLKAGKGRIRLPAAGRPCRAL